MLNKINQNKEIARAMFLYISYSILGPLLVIGGIGYIIDRILKTKFFLFFFIFIAYIVSNVLMFRKLKKLNKELDKIKIERNDGDASQVQGGLNKYDDDDEYNEKWPINQKESINESDSETNKS